MIKTVMVLFFTLASIFSPVACVWGDTKPVKSLLDELVERALAENPDLKAAENRWRLYEHKILPAGSLSDPSLSFTFSNYPVDSFAADEYAMTGNILRLSQTFPFPGKLDAKEEAAGQQAVWYKGVYEDARLQLAALVKEAYFSFYYFTKAVEITDNNLKLLDDFIRLAETNYEVGKGLQQDVLSAQMERSRLLDRLYSWQQKRESALADLNRLRNLPSSTAITDLAAFRVPDLSKGVEELQARSAEARPMFAAYDALVGRYKAEKKLALLEYKPDFRVGLAYTAREVTRADDGTDFVGIEFGINLPFSRAKREAAVEEAGTGVQMALNQYNDFRNKVHFNIQDAYTRMDKSREQALLYKSGIIPQASQTFDAALANYQVGKVSFFVLLDSLMRVYNYELEYYRALSDCLRSYARLEYESGVPLFFEEDRTDH